MRGGGKYPAGAFVDLQVFKSRVSRLLYRQSHHCLPSRESEKRVFINKTKIFFSHRNIGHKYVISKASTFRTYTRTFCALTAGTRSHLRNIFTTSRVFRAKLLSRIYGVNCTVSGDSFYDAHDARNAQRMEKREFYGQTLSASGWLARFYYENRKFQ